MLLNFSERRASSQQTTTVITENRNVNHVGGRLGSSIVLQTETLGHCLSKYLKKPAQIGTACTITRYSYQVVKQWTMYNVKIFSKCSHPMYHFVSHTEFTEKALSVPTWTRVAAKNIVLTSIFSVKLNCWSHADTWKTPHWHNGDMFCVCFHDGGLGSCGCPLEWISIHLWNSIMVMWITQRPQGLKTEEIQSWVSFELKRLFLTCYILQVRIWSLQ